MAFEKPKLVTKTNTRPVQNINTEVSAGDVNEIRRVLDQHADEGNKVMAFTNGNHRYFNTYKYSTTTGHEQYWVKVARIDNNDRLELDVFLLGDANYSYYARYSLVAVAYSGKVTYSIECQSSIVANSNLDLYATIDTNNYLWISTASTWSAGKISTKVNSGSGLLPDFEYHLAKGAIVRPNLNSLPNGCTFMIKSGEYFSFRYGIGRRNFVYQYPPEGWKDLSLLNGWSSLGGSHGTAQYRKVGYHIEVRGMIKPSTGTLNEEVALLPSGYRPSKVLVFSQIAEDKIYRFYVYTSGIIRAYNIDSSVTWANLTGISFSI